MKNEVVKSSSIEIKVGLNAEKRPVSIKWKSEDDPKNSGFTDCKAFTLSLFEKEYNETLKIDLWTNEMQVAEMDRFMYNTFKGLVDTYYKATNNGDLANEMQRFVSYFGEKTGIISEEG